MSRRNSLLLVTIIVLLISCGKPVAPATEQIVSPTSLPTSLPEPTETQTPLPHSPTAPPEPSLVSTPASPPITVDNADELALLAAPLDLGEPLVALALSSPGGLLASVGESGRIYSIEPNSLALQTTFDAPDPVRTLAVDPEGSTTVGTINGQILTIAGDGTLLQTIQLSDAGVPVNGLAYPSDGSQLAAALNNGAVMILDPESGSILQTLPTGSPIRALIYTPDSAILITAGDDGLIRYWDSAEGEPLYTGDIGHSATVNSLAQTEDGIILASGGADAEVKIYDDYSAQWLNTLLGHAGSVEALAFSPDGTLLASGDSTGRLIVWDVIVGQPLLTLDAVHVGGITGLTFTPDGSRLITTGLDGSVQMWGVPPE